MCPIFPPRNAPCDDTFQVTATKSSMKVPGLRRFATAATVSYSRPGRYSLYHTRTLQTAEHWNATDTA